MKKNLTRHYGWSLLIFCVATNGLFLVGAGVVASPVQESQESSIDNFPWRKTRIGWQDSTLWDQPKSNSVERGIELLHPAVVAGLILLASIGSLVWASEEWDFARLFNGEQHVCRRSQPRAPAVTDYLVTDRD